MPRKNLKDDASALSYDEGSARGGGGGGGIFSLARASPPSSHRCGGRARSEAGDVSRPRSFRKSAPAPLPLPPRHNNNNNAIRKDETNNATNIKGSAGGGIVGSRFSLVNGSSSSRNNRFGTRSEAGGRTRSVSSRDGGGGGCFDDSASVASGWSIGSRRSVRSSSGSSGGKGGLLGRFRRPSRRKNKPDDVSVTSSLCSGVIREELRNHILKEEDEDEELERSESKNLDWGHAASSPHLSSAPRDDDHDARLTADDRRKSCPTLPTIPPGEAYLRHYSDEHTLSSKSSKGQTGRTREKMDRYKRDRKDLKHSCAALERQLEQTTEKLMEVDSRAAIKIEQLEAELKESREGTERVARHSTKAATDQGEIIKSLGTKLIRQAHVIKRQKESTDWYKSKADALQSEMAVQDDREARRAEEYCQLKDRYEEEVEQKSQMQSLFQENLEELMDLKLRTEMDAKAAMEAKFAMDQKEAALDRVTKEAYQRACKVRMLELQVEEKDMMLRATSEELTSNQSSLEKTKKKYQEAAMKLERSEATVKEMRKELESEKEMDIFHKEVEKLRAGNLSGGGDQGGTGNDATNIHSPPITKRKLWKEGEGNESPGNVRQTLAQIGRGWSNRANSRDSGAASEATDAFEAELLAKDVTIRNMDDTLSEQEDTIERLKSDIVKLSMAFKQESIAKKKENVELRRTNDEFALRLRSLEKTFKTTGGNAGGGALGGGGGISGGSAHGPKGVGLLKRLGRSMHAIGSDRGSLDRREDRATAAKARLGHDDIAPLEIPKMGEKSLQGEEEEEPQKEEKSLTTNEETPTTSAAESNLFGGSEAGSEDGRKGEFPEEC